MFFTIVHQEKTIRLINMKEDVPGEAGGSKGNRLEKITLFDNSGVLKLSVSSSKLFLLISEAVVKGDNVAYPTAGTVGEGRTSNYKVLKVNNLTGRVEFYNEN